MIIKKPIVSEKAMRIIETENTIIFLVDLKAGKVEIEKEVERLFNVKVDKIRTHIKGNEKIAYVKLKKENLAIDVATKLGVM